MTTSATGAASAAGKGSEGRDRDEEIVRAFSNRSMGC